MKVGLDDLDLALASVECKVITARDFLACLERDDKAEALSDNGFDSASSAYKQISGLAQNFNQEKAYWSF